MFLVGVILLAVDLLLWLLLGLCGDLLNVVVALLVLIEVKIQVGICGLVSVYPYVWEPGG